jgi:ubiquinone/menaquinone biosynthesis C-methylase UbiE
VENSAAYLMRYLQPGLSLLDVGCGPGTITLDLARRVAPGSVVGLDAAAAAITAASASVVTTDGNVRFVVGDAYALDLADNSVDIVHAHQVLQHLSDPVAALTEWRRVTKPGGVVAARDADYEAFTWWPADPRLDRWLDLYRAVARRNQGEPDAARRLLAWAHEAGFERVTATATVWCFATPEDRDWWASTWADRATISAFATQLVAEGVATQAELEDIADAFRQWAQHPDAWWIIPHGEIICHAD